MNRSGGPGESQPVEPPSEPPRRYGRGLFLATVAGGLSSLVWGRSVWGHVSSALSGAESFVPLVPQGGWRIYTVAPTMPRFDPQTWRLEVGGLVQQKLSLSYDDLLALPSAHQVSDFHCVTGWTVHGVRWSGVRFAHLLDLVEPLPGAKAVRFDSLEVPYNDSLTLEQARLGDVLLALELDGKPLSRPHGSPARLVIPEMYGYKGVKWLRSIELVSRQPTGYWEGLGYDQDAWVGRSNGYSS